MEIGPAPLSLDHALDIEHSGTGWALLAFAAALAGPAIPVQAAEAAPAQAAA